MPYIRDEDRKCFAPPPNVITNAGELNYYITSIIHAYIKDKRLYYNTINEVIGVLECAKLELYRQIAAPYERKKHLVNGSVSELDKHGE